VGGLLAGKRLLITGILTESSIAFTTARLAQQEGATIVLTGYGRGLTITERAAKSLDPVPPVIELDVTAPEHLDSLADRLREHVDGLDGALHAIAFAPRDALGDGFHQVPWDDAAVAMQVSAWSLAGLTRACLPLFGERAAVVGLDFDAKVAWPAYGWMGVAKAALESTARYLAHELGHRQIRINLVSAGPLRTMAMRSIPGVQQLESAWDRRAPLGWDVMDSEPTGRACVALLSDWFPATTGEIVHVDGGYHLAGV
jgi:enoyl ACP reductase